MRVSGESNRVREVQPGCPSQQALAELGIMMMPDGDEASGVASSRLGKANGDIRRHISGYSLCSLADRPVPASDGG
ncbi:hypothetical protein GCM10023194_56850 [Planotetraspora phitsanulokensis]|uniref:Uncharacterized protein n=1 Tax=Planotetraspora phitsanulokensis TaxID=575192 RepID=A0A8J3XID4_9ACTN|nr:hypothetical protein Pph01_80450 [Planotetraspora phitsanulokensis]